MKEKKTKKRNRRRWRRRRWRRRVIDKKIKTPFFFLNGNKAKTTSTQHKERLDAGRSILLHYGTHTRRSSDARTHIRKHTVYEMYKLQLYFNLHMQKYKNISQHLSLCDSTMQSRNGAAMWCITNRMLDARHHRLCISWHGQYFPFFSRRMRTSMQKAWIVVESVCLMLEHFFPLFNCT